MDNTTQQENKVSRWWWLAAIGAVAVAVYYWYTTRKEVTDKMAKVREAKEIKRQMNLTDVSEN